MILVKLVVLILSELGLRLKHARESKAMTLEELQNVTKIQKRYLIAIEEGHLDMLPGQFYARAFIKNYAEAVGVNPEVLFEEHANELPVSRKTESELPPRVYARKGKSSQKTEKVLSVLPTVVVFSAILILVFGIWYFLNPVGNEGIPRDEAQNSVHGGKDEDVYIDEQQDEVNEPIEDAEDTDVIVEEDEPIVESEPQEFIFVETKRNESVYDLVNAEEFNVRIALNGLSYIGINNEKGMSFYAQNASEGDSLEFDFSEEEAIQMNIGASNNVKLFINEELFEFPLDVVHQKVTIRYVNEEELEE